MSDASVLENRVRRIIAARLRRGDKGACAAAAGHQAPWITKWLKGDLHATVDEMQSIAAFVGLSLSRLLADGKAATLDADLLALLSDEKTATQVREFLALPEPIQETVRGLAEGLRTHLAELPARARKSAQTPETRTRSAGGRHR
jgi:hypothetical protein